MGLPIGLKRFDRLWQEASFQVAIHQGIVEPAQIVDIQIGEYEGAQKQARRLQHSYVPVLMFELFIVVPNILDRETPSLVGPSFSTHPPAKERKLSRNLVAVAAPECYIPPTLPLLTPSDP